MRGRVVPTPPFIDIYWRNVDIPQVEFPWHQWGQWTCGREADFVAPLPRETPCFIGFVEIVGHQWTF